MKKINQKILKKVYGYETKKTAGQIISLIGIFAVVLLAIFLLGSVIVDLVIEQEAVVVFDFFSEDLEVVKKYFFDSVYVFINSIPQLLIFLFLIGILILVLVVYIIIRNFTKIKNKVELLIKFWSRKNK